MLVSPSYTDLGDDQEKQSGYFDTPWQWEKIGANQQHVALITGDDDPYIPQAEFDFIASKLKPTRIVIKNGKHFIDQPEFPELLGYIQKEYGTK